jgi:hypothetical protein
MLRYVVLHTAVPFQCAECLLQVVSKKPNWEIGAAQKISLKKPVTAANPSKPAVAWSNDSATDLIVRPAYSFNEGSRADISILG